MQLFSNVNIDFMKHKTQFVVLSTLVNLFGLGIFIAQYMSGHLAVGIDFKGGTEVQVKFAKQTGVAEVRAALDKGGLGGASVTTFGKPTDNEIYIRLPLQNVETQVLSAKIKDVMRGLTGEGAVPEGKVDVNTADEKILEDTFAQQGHFSPDESRAAALAITEHKKNRGGMITSADELKTVAGASPQITAWLAEKAFISPFSIRGQNSVEGSVSKELARKAFYAVIGSMLVMLVYIAFRFRFQYGLGAIVATIHDVIVTLGIFCLTGQEWSIPVVAAFLTLTGYSTNDTIVVFDRIRENLSKKGAGNLEQTINASINQTLSRTLITSGLTWLVVVALFLLGGEVLRGFAFVLMIGIIVGTYSSIFIASPIVIFWDRMFAKKKAAAEGSTRARARA
jgi:preprotein translocase subunit SecF